MLSFVAKGMKGKGAGSDGKEGLNQNLWLEYIWTFFFF